MSDMERPADTELHAYLDGELDDTTRAEVEAWLEANPDDADRVDGWRHDRDGLAALQSEILGEPVPEKMQAIIRRAPQRTDSGPGSWMRAAAAVVLLVTGAAVAWFAHDLAKPAGGEKDFVRNAVGAHVVFTKERRHAVEVNWGKEQDEKHLVRWLSRRLGRPLNPPPLNDAGYSLVGGRLVADDGGPAAQFMYQDKDKKRLTLYVRSARDAEGTAFRIASERGVSAFYWIDRTYAYALVGQIDRERLVPLGELVYQHLDKPVEKK